MGMQYIFTLLLAYSSQGAVPPTELSIEIHKVAQKYHIAEYDLVRIVLVESGGRPKAKNARTHDYGIAQINIHTANSMHVPMSCLMDWKCNLDVAGRILQQLQRGKHYRICHYNTGPRRDISKFCLSYERKLATIY